MNLADAIRKAAQHHVPIEATPVPIHDEPTQAPAFEVEDVAQAPETVAIPESFQAESREPSPMNSTPEPTGDLQSGAAVRLELFLTPEQLSNLFRAVAANQHTMLTLREAASYLRVSSGSLESLAHEGEIPGFLIDGKWRFSKAAIDEWLTAQQVQRKESA